MHLRNSQSKEKNKSFLTNVEWQDMPREGCAVTAFQVDAELPHNDHELLPDKTRGNSSLEDTLIDAFSEVR
jgi:hypothetical protein